MRVSRNEVAMDAASAALGRELRRRPQRRRSATASGAFCQNAQAEGTTFDVKRWSHAADLSSMRAGLLLAGDVAQARDSITSEPQNPSDLSQDDRLVELLRFAVSDLYTDLRGAIGIAVEA